MPTQRLLLQFLTLIILFSISCNKDESQKNSQNTQNGRTIDIVSELSFLDKNNQIKSTIGIAVAQTTQERNLGLMDVSTLGNDEGMIFLFEKEQPLTFWMANTPLPLDIIFADSDSTIIRIHKNTQPYSNNQYGTEGQNALYVVETNAGYCTTYDIKEGDRIRF